MTVDPARSWKSSELQRIADMLGALGYDDEAAIVREADPVVLDPPAPTDEQETTTKETR